MSRGAGEQGSRGAVAFVILAALVLAGCMIAPAVTRGPEMPGDWILEDTAPTTVFTAPPRTARPTRPAATATGTVAPTPTLAAGVYLYRGSGDPRGGGGTGGDCYAAQLTAIPTEPMQTRAVATVVSGQSIAIYDIEVCNTLSYPVTFDVRQGTYNIGWSTTELSYYRCLLGATCNPAFDYHALSTYQQDSEVCVAVVPIGRWAESEETNRVVVWPWATVGATDYNVYHFRGYSAANGTACEIPEDAWSEYEFIYAWDSNPGYATPTREATRDAWITEVLARPEGATCGDWNLRGGCGDNDQFVEVGVPSVMSLADYRIAIETTDGQEVCSYTVADDNLTEPLKAFWQDFMVLPGSTPTPSPTPTGTVTPVASATPFAAVCGTWPEAGDAVLYDDGGIEIDRRAYDYSGGGQYGDSWAATDWTNPGGQWWWYSPSPGKANRIPPTATPTVTPTP